MCSVKFETNAFNWVSTKEASPLRLCGHIARHGLQPQDVANHARRRVDVDFLPASWRADVRLRNCAGGQLLDAVSVCAREMGDPQLALFLARLMETPEQPLVRDIVHKELLPGAGRADCQGHRSCKACAETLNSCLSPKP